MLPEYWEFDRKMIHEKYEALVEGLKGAGLSPDTVQIVTTRNRAAVGHILTGLAGYCPAYRVIGRDTCRTRAT